MHTHTEAPKVKKIHALLETPERNTDDNILLLAQWDVNWTSHLQNCKTINLCCFKQLRYANLLLNALWFSSIQSLSHVWLFATPWTAACQASLSITNCWSPPKPMSIVSLMPSNRVILCHRLLFLPSIFPSIRVFSSQDSLESCSTFSLEYLETQHSGIFQQQQCQERWHILSMRTWISGSENLM